MAWKEIFSKIPVLNRKYLSAFLMLIGASCGFMLGSILVLVKDKYTSRQIMYVGFPGEIFLNVLRCMALPTRISCLISAVGSMEMKISKKIGLQLLALILITKFIAAFVGISLALLIRLEPVETSEKMASPDEYKTHITPIDRYLDMIRNMFPDSMVGMTLHQHETVLNKPENGSDNMYEWPIGRKLRGPRNMLGTANYALIFGAAVAVVGRDAKPILEVCKSISTVSFKLTLIFWRIAPLLIISLISSSVMRTGSAGNLAHKIAIFTIHVIWGHAVQCWFVYPLFYFAVVRKNPYVLMWNYMDAVITAYASASSIAALPVSMKCLEEKAKINKKLVRFAVPIANAISMDGTALYQAAAVVFFAKLNNTSLSIGDMLSIMVLSVTSSIAAGRNPLGNVVAIVIVLSGIGLPHDHVGLLLAIDWFIDHSSTATNVLGDCILVGILAMVNQKLLESIELEEEAADLQ